jgi:hypothetical protein
MPKIYTYKEMQDRILRRMGRDQNDAAGREEVKDGINEVYTDIASRKDEWQRIHTVEDLVFGAGDLEKTTVNLFQAINSVWMLDSTQIRVIDPITRAEFNRFIKSNSSDQVSFPLKYMIAGSSVDSATMMHQVIRIWPPTTGFTMKIDGIVWPADLVADGDKPRLTPDLCYALILGATAYCLDNDEDARADMYTLKFEAALERAIMRENYVHDDYSPVMGNLTTDDDSDIGRPKYPWER